MVQKLLALIFYITPSAAFPGYIQQIFETCSRCGPFRKDKATEKTKRLYQCAFDNLEKGIE